MDNVGAKSGKKVPDFKPFQLLRADSASVTVEQTLNRRGGQQTAGRASVS